MEHIVDNGPLASLAAPLIAIKQQASYDSLLDLSDISYEVYDKSYPFRKLLYSQKELHHCFFFIREVIG